MGWVVGIVIGAWFVLGSPQDDVAGWFWPKGPAPWEEVDAFYYPDRYNLSISINHYNVETVENCRDWAYAEATFRRDPKMMRGDYECGVGQLEKFGSITVYRLTVQ